MDPPPGFATGVESRIPDCPGFPYMGRPSVLSEIFYTFTFKLQLLKHIFSLIVTNITTWEVLPYISYIGMCCCEGYGFQAVYSGIGYINHRVKV